MLEWNFLTAARPWTSMLAVLVLAGCVTANGITQTQVQRGEYLARAGDCQSCHTAKGDASALLAGGRRIDTPFGYMLTPNITPDPNTGIGGWSSDDFYRALHDGVNKRGEDMYPTMPYIHYTKVSRSDVNAIYAYLKTVKPVKNAIDINHLHFPYNQRLSLVAWRELYFHEGAFKPDADRSAAWNRGAYLVEGLGHCSDCHSPRNSLGAVEKTKKFSGALLNNWYGPNLNSDMATGLGSWTVEDIATYLKTGAYRGKTTALGPMSEVVQTSTSHLNDADLKAMGEYFKSLTPDSHLIPADPKRQQGAKLYADNCAECHQSNGRGIPGAVPPLAGNGAVVAPDPSDVINVVLRGIPPRGTYVRMPSFAPHVTDAQIAEIANYVRMSWGNAAPANATAKVVAKLRVSVK